MNCVGYSRVSTQNQTDGHSIETQNQIIKSYARNNKLNIIQYYSDVGSGTKMNKLNNFNYIIDNYNNITLIVSNADRFSRNLSEACHYLDKMKKKNIILQCVEQNINSATLSSTRLLKTYINDAEFESKMIGLRIKKTMNTIKKKGGHVGGVRYGFIRKKIRGLPIIIKNDKEQLVINLIIDLRLGIKSSAEISESIKKITKINKPIIFYDKHDNEIEKFAKPFSLSFQEIADLLNDYKININNKKCKGITINNIFNRNCDKNIINKLKNKNVSIISKLFSNLGF